jgi:hypothetical protein
MSDDAGLHAIAQAFDAQQRATVRDNDHWPPGNIGSCAERTRLRPRPEPSSAEEQRELSNLGPRDKPGETGTSLWYCPFGYGECVDADGCCYPGRCSRGVRFDYIPCGMCSGTGLFSSTYREHEMQSECRFCNQGMITTEAK